MTDYGKQYRKRRGEGRCVWCGKENQTRVYCPECKLKMLAYAYRYILEHPTYHIDYVRMWRELPGNKERQNRANNARRYRLRAEGKCRECAQPNDRPGLWLCSRCAERASEYHKKWRENRKKRGKGNEHLQRD